VALTPAISTHRQVVSGVLSRHCAVGLPVQGHGHGLREGERGGLGLAARLLGDLTLALLQLVPTLQQLRTLQLQVLSDTSPHRHTQHPQFPSREGD
jgi:hypothetical protein